MANDRVVTVPIGGPQIDSSGVGRMLFQQFEEARKDKAEAAQLDVTEGIRARYRQAEAAQGNVFNEGLTKLRAFLSQQATDVAYQREQEARQQAARSLEGMIGGAVQQGVPMPGLTTTPPLPEGVAGPVRPQVAPIEPGAVELAKDQYGRGMDLHFKKLEAQTGLQMEAEKKALFESLDRVDDTTAMDAREWHNRFKALEADPRLLATIEGYTKPGQGSKTEWSSVKTKMIPEELKLTSQAATKMALAREITARQKNIAELRVSVQRALANVKMDATQFQNLARLHASLGEQAKGLMTRHAQTLEAVYSESDPQKQVALNQQAAQLRHMAEELQQYQAQVTQKMSGWQPVNPGTTPGQTGPTLPGGFQTLPKPGDPLGILPGTPRG